MSHRLNSLPVHLQALILALVILGGAALAADLGYRWLAVGTTDMTLPAQATDPVELEKAARPPMVVPGAERP